jgi:hypothetical protein
LSRALAAIAAKMMPPAQPIISHGATGALCTGTGSGLGMVANAEVEKLPIARLPARIVAISFFVIIL